MKGCFSLVRWPAVRAFSLVELLGVIVLITGVLTWVMPSVTSIGEARGVTHGAYGVADAITLARNYAVTHNTYTWVGFFEENGAKDSTVPATAGTGRLVVAVVASKDGRAVWDSGSGGEEENAQTPLAAANLSQVDRLRKIGNVHLDSFPDGSGGGESFDTRPAVNGDDARIGDTVPPPSRYPFACMGAGRGGGPQYVFSKTIRFSPRGEAVLNGTSSLLPILEIGLRPARGSRADAASQNLCAIQVGGMAGNITVYRK